ncbi:MAG: hypothetical protein H7249_05485 [Chitinophagaceae bacterium]|nr:hypothetical protein [Oligoflexus sp.]
MTLDGFHPSSRLTIHDCTLLLKESFAATQTIDPKLIAPNLLSFSLAAKAVALSLGDDAQFKEWLGKASDGQIEYVRDSH